jgi:hypothetical protein
MPRYKVVFSKRWLTGRWGFTDRVLDQMGGKPSEPSRTENAWLVPFEGTPFELGRLLTEALHISRSRDARGGAVFHVESLEPREPKPRRGKSQPQRGARRLPPPDATPV